MEYEFYNDRDTKVNVSPGSQLEQVIKAKFVGGVQAAKTGLEIRPARMPEPKDVRLKAEYTGQIQIEDIPLKDLRNAAK